MRSGVAVGTHATPTVLGHVGQGGALGGWLTLHGGLRGPLGRQKPPEQLSLRHPGSIKNWTFRAQALVQELASYSPLAWPLFL